MIRPSSLPMLAACPSWVSAPETGQDDKDAGTLRHMALAKALAGDLVPLQSLADDEAAAVEWALEYVKVHSPEGHEVRIEQRVSVIGDDFEVITAGTPDATCGPELFDLKWRERNYREQMAAYALAMMQEHEWPQVRCHVLYAERKHAEVFTLTQQEAADIVFKTIAEVGSRTIPCEYCSWCANRAKCPALIEVVNKVVAGREDWSLPTYHASELADAESMGVALRISRALSAWCEAIEHHAKEMAKKQGVVPAGFKLQNRQGNRYVTSVTDAFAKIGMPQEEFLKLCDVGFTDLVEAYAKLNGMKKAQAERTVEEKLGDVIKRKSGSISLVAEKVKSVCFIPHNPEAELTNANVVSESGLWTTEAFNRRFRLA